MKRAAGPAVLRYAPRQEFARVLTARVQAELARPRPRRRHLVTSLSWVVFPAWLLSSWAFLVFAAGGPVVAAVGIVSAGLALAGGLMAIAHPHVHRYGARQPRWLRLALAHLVPSALCDVWWSEKHNGSHHRATGVHGHDTDLDYGSLIRLSEQQSWRWWQRFQVVYVPLLYPFAHLAMVSAQWRFLATGRLSDDKPAVSAASERAFGAVLSITPPAVWIVAALAFRPAAAVLVTVLGVFLVSGLTLAAVFQTEHQVVRVVPPSPDEDGRVRRDWSTSQLLATADVATHRRGTTFYVGALNHHVEHHLFPGIAIADLPRLGPIVRQTAAEFDMAVVEYPGFVSAWVDHLRFLDRMGRRPTAMGPDEVPAGQRQSSRSTVASAALAAS